MDVDGLLPVFHVWEWFEELATRRTSSGVGMNPITHQDVLAWTTLMQVSVTPWEATMLLRIDNVFVRAMNDAISAKAKKAVPRGR